MRKFLFILACVFSFCVRADTNIVVALTPQQWQFLETWLNDNGSWALSYTGWSNLHSDGSLTEMEGETSGIQLPYDYWFNIKQILSMFHLIIDGTLSSSYDTSSNNILAYASSLRGYLNSYSNSVYRIDDEIHYYLPKILERQLLGVPQIQGLYNDRFYAGNKVMELTNLSSNNFDRLYTAITNLDLQVSISNQIDLLQVMNGTSEGISNNLEDISKILLDFKDLMDEDFVFINTEEALRHNELMHFLYSLTNGTLFASNVLNSCCCSNNQEAVSNYQDSVLAMLGWMTNQWTELAPADPTHSDGSNSVWSVWIPSDEDWVDLLIPNVAWEQNPEIGGWRPLYKPKDEQYDGNFKRISTQYYDLLEHYEAGDIDGQKFFAGLVDLQLHILANMSTQLYMIDEKMPTKTNLWQWIEQYKTEVQERVTEAQAENSEAVSTASALLDYTPFSVVGGHFPKVSRALNSLRVENDASPVVHIPIPRALRVSDSDELIVDVRESDWFVTGRNWCRWIFTFIWGWLFIRMGLIPVFYIFFFTVRVAEISAHLVFMGSVRGSSGIVSSFGAAAVDMVLSLIGIDTDFKKFVWGIMRD